MHLNADEMAALEKGEMEAMIVKCLHFCSVIELQTENR